MSVIDTVKELIAAPSHSGETGEMEYLVASKVGEIADADFMPVQNMGRNVVSKVVHDDSLPTIIINGHLDTVAVCKGWTREPLAPTVDGDKIYGLGSADMKAGVAVAIEAFRMLADIGTFNVTFAGTIDEEGDSTGAFELLDNGIKADLCLIPEPSHGNLMMGCRGRLVFEILIRGRSAHGAVPEEGVNAIEEASKFVCALEKIEYLEHHILGRGSSTVLAMEGGTRTLSVPESCRIKLDRHYVPGETMESCLQQLKDAAASFSAEAEFDIRPDPTRKTPFLEPYVTLDEGMASHFCQSVGAEYAYGRSVGDYNAFSKVMPTVVYGPHGGNWHSADEWVSISSIEECLEGYRSYAASLKA